MGKFAFLHEHLRQLEADNLLRRLRRVESAADVVIRTDSAERPLVNFSSNNYLNLASDPRVVDAVCSAIQTWGFGAVASRLICGTMGPHLALEKACAAFFRKQAALLFTSGWTANAAVIGTLPQKGDLILMDKADHASILDAAAASGADFRTYRRGDHARLKRLLQISGYKRKFIVTESVFSMDGDCADLVSLVELRRAHDAILIVDEAHSAGCMGPTGAGLAEHLGLLEEIDVIIAPLGKAFGAAGAIVAADQVVIDYLINRARPLIYTTAPPPGNAAAALAALEIIRNEPHRRRKLQENAAWLRSRLKEQRLDTGNSSTWVIPVIIGDSGRTLRAAERLAENGFLLVAIRPPTVPPGTARLRISVQAGHTKDQLDALAAALPDVLAG